MKNVVREKDIENYEAELMKRNRERKNKQQYMKKKKWKNEKKYRNEKMMRLRQEEGWKEKHESRYKMKKTNENQRR